MGFFEKLHRHAANTTCSGMTRVSFTLYSGSPAADSGWHGRKHCPRQSWPHKDLGRIAMDNDSYNNDGDNVGGYAVPVDPMDLLQCDSCQ